MTIRGDRVPYPQSHHDQHEHRDTTWRRRQAWTAADPAATAKRRPPRIQARWTSPDGKHEGIPYRQISCWALPRLSARDGFPLPHGKGYAPRIGSGDTAVFNSERWPSLFGIKGTI